jgi:hypothetical protein
VLCPNQKTWCSGCQYCPDGTLCSNCISSKTHAPAQPPVQPPTSTTPRFLQVTNRLVTPLWIGTTSGATPNNPSLPQIGPLGTNESYTYVLSSLGWNGRLFFKTNCDAQGTHCTIGQQANSLVEFNIPGATTDTTWYDISLVDGYTLPLTLAPTDTRCVVAQCGLSLSNCPSGLLIPGIACLSPCSKTHNETDCCGNLTPQQCSQGPIIHTPYVQQIHQSCPTVYAYSYDDANGLHTCPSATSFHILVG